MHIKLIEFLKELVANGKIGVKEEVSNFKDFQFIRSESLDQWALQTVKENIGITLTKNNFYTENFSIKWEKKSNGSITGQVYGGFDISIFRGLCGDQDEWLKENPLNHQQELVDNLYSFNNNEIELHRGQFGKGCFYREHSKWPLDIYFFDNGVRIKMDISLELYIQALIDSCAVGYWQYFYVDVNELIEQNSKITLRMGGDLYNYVEPKEWDKPRLPHLINELDVFVTNLPILFPEKDFSYHKNRLAQIKEKAQSYL